MKWEYLVIYVAGKIVPFNGENVDVQDFLDVHGREGWELVTAAPLTIHDSANLQEFPSTSQYVLHLKRELKTVKGTRDVSPVHPTKDSDSKQGGTVN
jgi:hypothetical protein